jgi:ABC-type uncharacterized transport system fused permease/ATPase subunit
VFDAGLLSFGRHHPLRRFWTSARGFWHGPTARLAWGLIALLIVVTVLQLVVQYRLTLSSINRVGNLLMAFDRLETAEGPIASANTEEARAA